MQSRGQLLQIQTIFVRYYLDGLQAMQKRGRFRQNFCKFELWWTHTRKDSKLERTQAFVDLDSDLTVTKFESENSKIYNPNPTKKLGGIHRIRSRILNTGSVFFVRFGF